jgi:deoxyribonuclease V
MTDSDARNKDKSSMSGRILNQQVISHWEAIQKRLARKVIQKDSFEYPPKLVAGVDVAYQGNEAFSAAVVLDNKTLRLVEKQVDQSIVSVPYVPSYLAFREVPLLTNVIQKLKQKADVFLVNAHGVAHPLRCGCASHLGVVLDIPTIGVAKRVLSGKISESEQGEIRYLRDGNEVIGATLMTRGGSSPIFVSVGHKVGLTSAIGIVQGTLKEARLPEPLEQAHRLSNESRKETHN